MTFTAMLCVLTISNAAEVSAQSTAVAEPEIESPAAVGAEGDASQGKTAENQAPDSKDKASREFMRVLKKGKQPQSLQTAVVKYRKPGDDSVEVTLIGAVHIAEPTYYSRLNQLFREFDSLLFEAVMDPELGVPDPDERGLSPVSTIQVGMTEALDLSFQLDEIDYHAENFVHADMTPQEFLETMEKRKEGFVQLFLRSFGAGLAMQSSGKGSDLDLVAALVANDRTRAVRRAFASQLEMADGQMAAITGKDGKSTLITERNAKAFKVLDQELKSGKKKLGVFYGAGHLKDMDKRLREEFGMEMVDKSWLDAWDLR